MEPSPPVPWIIGQGLAGSCLAWEFWKRGVEFRISDRGHGGSSRIAAGMINPITGKNFQPSWRIAEFLPKAVDFYSEVEQATGSKIWHPLTVLRLAETEKEWEKIVSKLSDTEVFPWILSEVSSLGGWVGGIEIGGGGRLDVPEFLRISKKFFEGLGCYEEREWRDGPPHGAIDCRGAEALIEGGKHRCAKGEILTLRAPEWEDDVIRVGAGGWLVPVGGETFKAGSTYEWNELDEIPTMAGREKVESQVRRLAGDDFEVIAHEAAVRPILRRSQPLIGPQGGGWMFNGLGSKGSLYAPAVAGMLADWICLGIEPEPVFDIRNF